MNKKILIILVIIVIIIIGVVYLLQQPKYAQNTEQNTPPVITNPTPTQTTPSETNAAPETYNVTVENFAFNPAELNIKSGDTVIWTNQDSAAHRISGNGFQSDNLSKGQSFSFTFKTAGSFDYNCSIHPSMKGKVTVQ